MAASTRIVLIIACCAIVSECRLRGKFKQQKNFQEINAVTEQVAAKIKINDDHEVSEKEKTFDSDAVIFPSDNDDKIYLDVNKIASDIITKDIKKDVEATRTTNMPLLPKVVLAKEAKEVFTNPIRSERVTFKTVENIEASTKPTLEPAEEKIALNVNVNHDSRNLTLVNITKVESLSNDTSNSNDSAPDFLSRFGDTSRYMLVPANNVQTYQPIPTDNIHANQQGNLPQYVYNDQGNPMNLANTQYIPNANIASDIGTNSQYLPQNTMFQNDPNANLPANVFSQGTSYVPVTVSNTYLINGQLYAALTVPNNVNVPNSIYLINSQLPQSGHQVPNNLPVYNMVAGDQNNVNTF